jgi:hypothetical protein
MKVVNPTKAAVNNLVVKSIVRLPSLLKKQKKEDTDMNTAGKKRKGSSNEKSTDNESNKKHNLCELSLAN